MIHPDKLNQLLQTHATPAEREAIDLVFDKQLGIRRAAETLGISRSALRDRIDNFRRKLAKEGHQL